MKLKHIIIMQNKIDLVKESQAKEQHDQIVKFVQGLSLVVAMQFRVSNAPGNLLEICKIWKFSG